MTMASSNASTAASSIQKEKEERIIDVMFLCDEWKSSKGGLTTFNREFAIRLAQETIGTMKIHCYVSKSKDQDREDARQHEVNLITARNIPGSSVSLECLKIPPSELPNPQLVIGHGRKFGGCAYFLVQATKCKWIQFVHVYCEDLGKYKTTIAATDSIEENEKKHKMEIELCKAADAVVAVGSRLQQKYSRSLPNLMVEIITPGIFEKFSCESQCAVRRSVKNFNVFLFGRATFEDLSLKGYDIVANAIGSLGKNFELTFVGSSPGEHQKVEQWFLGNTCINRSQLTIRGYCSDPEDLKTMFYQSDMVALPSRTEGFGLVALEAISAGVPVLVSGESGVAEALKEVDGGNAVIVESDEDVGEWARRIRDKSEESAEDRQANAMKLRENYRMVYSWRTECATFRRMIEDVVKTANDAKLNMKVEVEDLKPKEPNVKTTTLATESEGCQGVQYQRASATSPTEGIVSHSGTEDPQELEKRVLCSIAMNYLQTTPPQSSEERNEFKEYLREMRVIITGSSVGSLVITVKCESLQILEELWTDYSSGHLGEVVQNCFVTEKILKELNLAELKLKTAMDIKEYNTRKVYLKRVALRDALCTQSYFIISEDQAHLERWKLKTEVRESEKMKEDIICTTEGMSRVLDRGRFGGRGSRGGRGGRGGRGRGTPQNAGEGFFGGDRHQQRPHRGRQRGPHLGYRKLKEIRSMEPSEMAVTLLQCRDSFEFLVNADIIQEEWMTLLVEILGKMCNSMMIQNLIEVLSICKGSALMHTHLPKYILSLPLIQEEMDSDQFSVLVECLITFFKEWLAKLPHSFCYDVPIDKLSGAINEIDLKEVEEYKNEVETLLLKRREQIGKERKMEQASKWPKVKRQEEEPPPPNDFREISIYPSETEINSEERPFLRRNKTAQREKYKDLDDYLDVQFRLLREDFVAPLREGIREIRKKVPKKSRSQDLYIYENVEIMTTVCTMAGIVHSIRLEMKNLRKIPWEHSKRLLYGSFLCLSKDNFETMLFATVANRKPEELRTGRLDIRFVDGLEATHRMHDKFVMVESPAYFEAYRPILQQLKQITSNTFPFQEYLVHCNSDVKPPQYLKSENQVWYDLRETLDVHEGADKVAVCDFKTWPNIDDVKLNDSQFQALKGALTEEFSVIQGPPGTGKTYVGLKVVRALIDNRHAWDEEKKSTMLMVCYTNHALDQFLEGVLKFQQTGVIRVGGRSSSVLLKAYNLQEHIKPSESKRWVKQEMKKCQEAIQRVRNRLARSKRNILSLIDLQSFVGHKHLDQFKAKQSILNLQGKSVLERWLGLEQITEVMRSLLNETQTAESVAKESSSSEDAKEAIEDNIEVDREAEIIQNQRLLGENQFQILKKQDNAEQEKQRPTNLSGDHLKVLAGESSLQPLTVSQVSKINDIWILPIEDRWRLYLFWLRLFQSICREEISKKTKQYEDICKRFTEIKTREEFHALKDALVIGMTTTGAAKYRALLEEIKPTLVVVEEAAEVLEAHIITSLTKNTQHLILIGDHLQLRPNPSVYTLAKDYHLDVSLFERMVNNGMPLYQLNTQHRMRPEIARLMRFIYKDLQDHEKVHKYEDVKGVSKNMYFIDHRVLEDESEVNDRIKSHSNKHEAQFIAALCEYFILQGYAPHEITVLTMYSGQVITLQRTMPKEIFQGVRVTAVDNFQGEENEIVLLSLVRSNKQRKIGFLAVENRVCVALSRARKGFYCIGNFSLLAEKSELWKSIARDMKDRNAIGEALELVCSNHPDRKIHARVADDFKSAPEGGCMLPCTFRLRCGHGCTRVCHPDDRDHALYKCQKDCLTEVCSEHQTKCEKKCHYGEDCLLCPEEVEKEIPKCGHQQLVPCGMAVEKFRCQRKCWNFLPCGHLCPGKCWEECASFQCKKIVPKKFDCGHEIEKSCWEVSEYVRCEEPCRAKLDCGHPCVGNCSECKQGRMHVPCKADCERRRVCLHPCKEPCTTNCPPCPEKCENRCFHSRCPRQCMEACTPCRERCTWVCPHFKCKKLCGEKCNRPRCNEPCRKKLKCNHPCIGLCGEPCPKMCRICHKDEVTQLHFGTEGEKNARFIELLDCGHVVEVTAMDFWMDNDSESDDIKLKECPRCQTPIRISYRYADIVKGKLADIEKVKAQLNQEEKKYQQLTENLKREAFSLTRNYPDVRRRKSPLSEEQTCKPTSYDILKGWLQQRKTMAELSTIKNQIKILIQIYQIRERMKTNLLRKTPYGILTPPSASHPDDMFLQAARDIDKTLNHLEEDLMKFQVSYQRLSDIRDEALCVSLSLNIRVLLCKIKERSITLAPDQEEWLKTLGRQLDAGQKLRNEAFDQIEDTINEIREECGLESLIPEDRIEISRPMNFSQGLWHRCPSGHPHNVLGECRECGTAGWEKLY